MKFSPEDSELQERAVRNGGEDLPYFADYSDYSIPHKSVVLVSKSLCVQTRSGLRAIPEDLLVSAAKRWGRLALRGTLAGFRHRIHHTKVCKHLGVEGGEVEWTAIVKALRMHPVESAFRGGGFLRLAAMSRPQNAEFLVSQGRHLTAGQVPYLGLFMDRYGVILNRNGEIVWRWPSALCSQDVWRVYLKETLRVDDHIVEAACSRHDFDEENHILVIVPGKRELLKQAD